MISLTNSRKLRSELQMISENNEVSDIKIRQIMEINNEHKASLELVPCNIDTGSFNCHMHTLGIEKSTTVDLLCRKNKSRTHLINGDFMSDLITHGLLKLDTKGLIGIYTDNGKITHSGKMSDNNLIISKWGSLALFSHTTEDVPSGYGNQFDTYSLYASSEEIIAKIQDRWNAHTIKITTNK